MEELQNCIRDLFLVKNNENTHTIDKLYQDLANFNDRGDYLQLENIFKSIQKLYDERKVRRDILYFVILSNSNTFLITELIKFEKSIIGTVKYPGYLYDFAVCKKRQWFEFSIENKEFYNNYDKHVYDVIGVLKLVHDTNILLNFNRDEIKLNFENLDKFWKTYFRQINFLWEVVEYCKGIEPNLNLNEIFSYSSQNALIQVFHLLDIDKFSFTKVYNILQQEDGWFDPNKNQVNNILAYNIISTIFKGIEEVEFNSNINNIIIDIKENLLDINHKKLIIELLENIFSILFTMTNHFTNREKVGNFICGESEIRLIIFLLKELLDEIKAKKIFHINSKEYSAFLNIQKHVTNALWRIEVIRKVKGPLKCKRKLLKYMLSMPESLIQMCLKEGDYERAYQVVQIFSLKGALAADIDYCQKLRNLKQALRQAYTLKALKETDSKVLNIELPIEEMVKDFFIKNPTIPNTDQEDFINNYDFDFLNHLKEDNSLFCNILDLAITQPTSFLESEKILHLAFEFNKLDVSISSKYFDFSKKLCYMISNEEYPRTSLRNMLAIGNYSLDVSRYIKDSEIYKDLIKYYNEFQTKMFSDEIGTLNNNHPNHVIAYKISNLCSMGLQDGESNTKYISKLLKYLKAFSKILFIEKNNSDIISNGKNSSFFHILAQNRSELMGKLLFERNLDPDEFEKYFGKLKLDYLYHVIGNCFPTINLHTEEHLAEEELYPENYLYIPKKTVLTYIQKRNWLLAFLLNKMYQVEGVNIGITEIRIKTFSNYSKLRSVKNLAEVYDSQIIAAIQNEVSIQKLRQYINSKIAEYECYKEANDNIETTIEIAEDITECMSRKKNMVHLLDITDSISEIQLRKNEEFSDLKDKILVKLVEECECFGFAKNIANRNLRMGILLNNLTQWPGALCIDLIKSEMTKFEEVYNGELIELNSWLTRVVFYEELKHILEVHEWSEAFNMCQTNKEFVISKLLECYNINLLQSFITLHTPNEHLLLKISESYVLKILEQIDEYDSIGKLLDILPFAHAIQICHKLLGLLRKISALEYINCYLLSNVPIGDNLKKIQISLKILKEFALTEQEQLTSLIQDPMSIIEVLIMNMKLDMLSVAIGVLRSEILHYEFSDDSISNDHIDRLLRKYAAKSLDFRVISHPNPRLLKTPDCKLMQSLDSLSLINDLTRQFILPDEVPARDDWIPNDEVIECMCCQKTRFSMFNRRHHCRRCGRVVCYYCSNHRMLVPTYEDIQVRVCNDCRHLMLDGSTAPSLDLSDVNTSTKSITDFWLLTNDPSHNEIVREEFSFEDASSISLCLSIMKFHRKTAEYPRLLLDQCGVLLRLLQPNPDNVEEIDYFLVIKMLKHLATAAKMASVECSEHYGISSADRILSQADLLNLFVERGCLNLLPVAGTNFSQSSYIDASVLRRLCDKLLEREQWNLALEVSTKAGLDSTGVFSAWGKSCLKAGNLLLARDIFQRCLDKTGGTESVSDLSIASDSCDSFRKSTSLSKSSVQTGFEAKSSKNPTLLKEIINCLEANMKFAPPNGTETAPKQLIGSTFTLNNLDVEKSIYILHKIKNLKNIAEGNIGKSDEKVQLQNFSKKPSPNVFYDECIYYLGKYGTSLNLLEFLVKNENIYEALKYIVDNQLNTDVFIKIYLKCLKDGVIGIFQGYILTIDSSFEIWKDYLRGLCLHLVKQNMLHSLYQLQQFMGDHVRAAMTCIKFYQENVNSFSDLSANTKYLIKAEKHLKDLVEQDQWVDVSPVHKLSSSMETFEEKSVNNSSLIMKMSSVDINKHINTICKQNEIVQFLSEREQTDAESITNILDSFLGEQDEEPSPNKQPKIPILFGTTVEKNRLAVLTILGGESINEGFKIGQSIIEDFNLKPIGIYCECGKILAKFEKYKGISQLVSCIKEMGSNSDVLNNMCDEMLTLAVATLSKANRSGTKVEDLIKLISDRPTKISAYIETKQLKTAYFLAVKYKRTSDIKKIMKEAELLNQPSIKLLCQKILQSHHHVPQSKK